MYVSWCGTPPRSNPSGITERMSETPINEVFCFLEGLSKLKQKSLPEQTLKVSLKEEVQLTLQEPLLQEVLSLPCTQEVHRHPWIHKTHRLHSPGC